MVVLLNLLVKPGWLLTENVVQNVLGHADMGLYAALLSFGFIFITLSDLGINQFTTKTLAGDQGLLREYFPNLLSLKLLITLLYPLTVTGLGWLWGYRGEALWFLALLCLVHGGSLLLAFFRANFQAMQRFKLDGVFSVLDKLILLGVVWVLLLTQISLESFIQARVWIMLGAALLAMLVLVRMYGWYRPVFNRRWLGEVLRKSWPFAVITIVYSVHDKVDQVMLQKLAGDTEAGLYVGAYRWMDAISMYLWTVLPIFFARFAFFKDNEAEKEKLLAFGQVISGLPVIFISIFGFFHGEKLLFLFTQSTGNEIAIMLACLQALFVALFINGMFSVFSTLLTSTGHEHYVNRMAVISIIINIALNWIFIPRYGPIASAWTTVASYGFMAISYVLFFQLRLPIRVPYGQSLLMLAAAGLTAGAFWLASYLGLNWWVQTLLAGVVMTGVAFVFRLVTIEKLRGFRVE